MSAEDVGGRSDSADRRVRRFERWNGDSVLGRS